MYLADAPDAVRVLVAVADQGAADGVAKALQSHGYEVHTARPESAALRAALTLHRPDVVLLDVGNPPDQGLEHVALVRGVRPDIQVVTLLSRPDRPMLRRLRDVNPSGYLVRPFTEQQLLTTLALAEQHAAPGIEALRASLSSIEHRLMSLSNALGYQDGRTKAAEMGQLSRREREVLNLLCANRRVGQIAATLSVSENTVRSHLKAMFRKLGVHSQAELIDLFRHQGEP